MTQTSTPFENSSCSEYTSTKLKPIRIAIIAVLLFLLIVAEFYMFSTVFSKLYDNLMTEYDLANGGTKKGFEKIIAWCVNEISLWLPAITICSFQYLVYHKYNRDDGIYQREMGFEILLVTILVYAVLLPIVAKISTDMHQATIAAGEIVDKYEKGGYITLLSESLMWFLRFFIPAGILSVYHFSRAAHEME